MSSTDPFILPFSGRGINYTEEDIQVVADAMRSADPLTQGPKLSEFQQMFSEYQGGITSFAVSSCTAALELTVMLSNISHGDEVIIPAHTYCSSAIPFARAGAKIVWADIDENSRVVAAKEIEPLVTGRTKAVVVVHLYGLSAPMDDIMTLAKERGFLVIEDCAQAVGASYDGKKVGTIGNFGCFSFHAQKNVTTLGEGGMLTVQSREVAELVPGLRHNGHRPYSGERERYWLPAMVDTDFDIEEVWPLKATLGEVQCALGTHILKRLDEISARRHSAARRIIESLRDFPELSFQSIPSGSTHVYHLLSARYDGEQFGKTRDDLIDLLANEYRIQAIVQYYPLYRYPMFYRAGFGEAHCPHTDQFYDNMVSLPFYPWFSDDQFDYLIHSVKGALSALRNTRSG
jgi:dTDP-4-amino-4,6-dideoxygalactose transaminase|tara:strand:+ start:1328 stop:2536 length:1209 start_codon:yes stop_codon:yes gene_type:complete